MAAPRTMSPTVTRASLAASHRARGTVWLQASRQVPYSSSLAISGCGHHVPHELQPGDRVETGHRLVEHEQRRPLGERHGQ
jgi:hypothetical protein